MKTENNFFVDLGQELENISTPGVLGFIKQLWMVILVTGFFSFAFFLISSLWIQFIIKIYL